MALHVDRDRDRFRRIVKGRIRRDLRKYMSTDEMVGKQGDRVVSIPLPQITIPRLVHGKNKSGGVGAGEGDKGDPVGEGDQPGQGQAGQGEGQHVLEVDVTIEELAEILGEELELPRIEPKSNAKIQDETRRYNRIQTVGPQGLRHFRRSYRRALRRQLSMGDYNPRDPRVIPVKEDLRFRASSSVPNPQSNAVILYMMDVSGSMGAIQKQIVRMEAFWIDAWLTNNYDNLERRFIVHDAAAREVDRDTFFSLRESGGTLISAAYKLAQKIIEEEYPSDQWNIYPFHFSDGDNWSGADTRECLTLLQEQMLPRVNVFCYGQVESEYGSGQFINDILGKFKDDDRVITSKIPNKDAVFDSIKTFLGKGR